MQSEVKRYVTYEKRIEAIAYEISPIDKVKLSLKL